jgi:replicative DNA helicase
MNQQVPMSHDAEIAVLGSILLDPECIRTIELEPEDFFEQQHRIIFEAMLSLDPDGINQVTVAEALSRKGRLVEIGGASYLSKILSEVPTSTHAEYYAEIVSRCAFNRRLISQAEKIIQIGYANEKPVDGLVQSQGLLNEISEKLMVNDNGSMRELAKRAADYYGDLRKCRPGILTGLHNLDDKLGGLQDGESTILAANTSVGKTTLALQIAANVAKEHKVIVFSEEMTRQQIINKLVASVSGISTKLINLGNYPDERFDRIHDALSELYDLNLRIEKCGTTGKMRLLIERHKPELVVIDYLQKLKDRHGKSEYERAGFISGEITSIAKEYDIPIICLSQLHRTEKREYQRPQLNDLRDSGKIEEDFDMVWGLYRESYKNFVNHQQSDNTITELWILKNRIRGNCGKVILNWDQEHECYKGGELWYQTTGQQTG